MRAHRHQPALVQQEDAVRVLDRGQDGLDLAPLEGSHVFLGQGDGSVSNAQGCSSISQTAGFQAAVGDEHKDFNIFVGDEG